VGHADAAADSVPTHMVPHILKQLPFNLKTSRCHQQQISFETSTKSQHSKQICHTSLNTDLATTVGNGLQVCNEQNLIHYFGNLNNKHQRNNVPFVNHYAHSWGLKKKNVTFISHEP